MWEYRSKFINEKLEKQNKREKKRYSNRDVEQGHWFLENHPQSETHWQNVRTKKSSMVPT